MLEVSKRNPTEPVILWLTLGTDARRAIDAAGLRSVLLNINWEVDFMRDFDLSVLGDKHLYELDETQAREILEAFLATESRAFESLRRTDLADVDPDYSPQSVVRFFHYVIDQFDRELSADRVERVMNVWVLRLAYYFGESLRRVSNHLRWDIGGADTAFQNHPVIAGFRDGTEAALITISKNTVLAVALDGASLSRVDVAVEAWFQAALGIG